MKLKNAAGILIAGALVLFFSFPGHAQQTTPQAPVLLVFYSASCHNCIRVEKEVMPAIEKEYKGRVTIEYRDIGDIENYKLLLGLGEKYHVQTASSALPIFFYAGSFVDGSGDVRAKLTALLAQGAGAAAGAASVPQIDLVKRFQGFTPLAIIAVGLIDGVNPCAVTVIVFFISFLSFQGYRKREIALIGLIFIASVYLTYVLIGFGIFQSLYQLRGFWLLTRIINITVGSISILFSIYALYDFVQYRKTKTTDDLLLSLPASIKNQIHKVIGSHYRVRTKPGESGLKKHMFGLAASALVTGFLVSVLEAVCVAKIYLPTIIFVLKTTSFKLKALVYLLVYNLLFVLPLIVIFIFALAGTTSERFSAILKGHLGMLKIIMGAMFLVLGIFLIWRA